MWLLGEEKSILGHMMTNFGTEKSDFWDRRSWSWIMMRRVMGQTMWFFGTGEVNIGSLWEELWDKMSWLFGTGEVEIGTYDTLGQEKLILDHIKIYFRTIRGVFWGQERLILSHNELNYGTWLCDFLGQEKLIMVIIGWIVGPNKVTFWDTERWD
jgi:hypothetical protein